MKKLKTVEEAVEFLEKKAGINVAVNHKFYKYNIWDLDINEQIETDKDLIDYANEQKEALEE
jgi:hypothetical protein